MARFRCNDLCVKYSQGYDCGLCNALAERDRFERSLVTMFRAMIRGLRRVLPVNPNVWNVLASIVIAYATLKYMSISGSQWKVMERQLGIMEYNQRPWVGVSQTPDVTEKPQPDIFKPDSNTLLHGMSYRLKNFGQSPARAVNSGAAFLFPSLPVYREYFTMQCQQAKAATQRGQGDILFPGSDAPTLTAGRELSGGLEDTEALVAFSVDICITYQDAAGQVQCTLIRYRSEFAPDAPWIVLNPGRPFRYKPFKKLLSSEQKAECESPPF
jgi:hypothetical protein